MRHPPLEHHATQARYCEQVAVLRGWRRRSGDRAGDGRWRSLWDGWARRSLWASRTGGQVNL